MKRDVTDAGVQAALLIAKAKFKNQTLIVNGTGEFKKRCVEVAARADLPITFSDIRMEKDRLEILQYVSNRHFERKYAEQNKENVFLVKTTESARHEKEAIRSMSRYVGGGLPTYL